MPQSDPFHKGVGETYRFYRVGKQVGRSRTARNRGFLESEPERSEGERLDCVLP